MSISSSDHLIPTREGRLFARRWTVDGTGGDRPHIILFHDSLGCVALWRDFPERLAKACDLPVIAYDRLGFGQSDASSMLPGLDFMGHEARVNIPALTEAIGFGRFIAFGHSVGGAMAVMTAAAMPDRCLAVITESAQSFVEDRTIEGIQSAMAYFLDPGQYSRLERYHGSKAAHVLESFESIWLSPRFNSWSLEPELARLRCKLLAIHGDQDEFGSLIHPRRIALAAAGGAELQILANCGHVPHRQQTMTVLEIISQFVRTQTV